MCDASIPLAIITLQIDPLAAGDRGHRRSQCRQAQVRALLMKQLERVRGCSLQDDSRHGLPMGRARSWPRRFLQHQSRKVRWAIPSRPAIGPALPHRATSSAACCRRTLSFSLLPLQGLATCPAQMKCQVPVACGLRLVRRWIGRLIDHQPFPPLPTLVLAVTLLPLPTRVALRRFFLRPLRYPGGVQLTTRRFLCQLHTRQDLLDLATNLRDLEFLLQLERPPRQPLVLRLLGRELLPRTTRGRGSRSDRPA